MFMLFSCVKVFYCVIYQSIHEIWGWMKRIFLLIFSYFHWQVRRIMEGNHRMGMVDITGPLLFLFILEVYQTDLYRSLFYLWWCLIIFLGYCWFYHGFLGWFCLWSGDHWVGLLYFPVALTSWLGLNYLWVSLWLPLSSNLILELRLTFFFKFIF